jgi:small subunit ribosomal protein S25e
VTPLYPIVRAQNWRYDFETFWTRLHELMLIPITVVQGKGYVITLAAEQTSFNTHSVKDKAQHAVILDKATSDKLYKDVQSYRLITVATLVDRLKINGSLARRCLADLEEKGQIKKVVGHSKLTIYSTFSCLPEPLPHFILQTSHLRMA